MKTLMTLAAGVLCSTLALADGATKVSGSSFTVTKSGRNLVNVSYRSQKTNIVTVSILNERKERVFIEKMKGENFVRPYNFRDLPAGQYTIKMEDNDGTREETVMYGAAEATGRINVSKIGSVDDRYLITASALLTDKLNISIYDGDGKLLIAESTKVNGPFAKVYNLNAIKGAFSIEISDASGTLKEFSSRAGD